MMNDTLDQKAFAAKLREVSDAGFANGYLAAIVRIGEVAILDRSITVQQLIPILQAEVRKHPGYVTPKVAA